MRLPSPATPSDSTFGTPSHDIPLLHITQDQSEDHLDAAQRIEISVMPELILEEAPEGEIDNEGDETQREERANSLQPSYERLDSVEESLRSHPAFLFITRPDLYEYAKVFLVIYTYMYSCQLVHK